MGRLKTVQKYVDRKLMKLKKDERTYAAAHLYGVSLAAAMIAEKRGLNTELLCIAAMLHDLYAFKSGSYENHGHLGAELAGKILKKLEITTPEETEQICSAIYHHNDKDVTDSPMDEALKDADVLDHCFKDPTKEVKEKEMKRYLALRKEFGLGGAEQE